MNYKKLKLCAVFLLGLGLTGLQAQEVIPATGGNALGVGGTMSYSVGQVFYTINRGTNGSVAQGVQQPFEISVVTGLEEAKGITLQCSVYPNPATDFLILKMEGDVKSQYFASLYDINGKLLENRNINGNEASIDMRNLATATYFLKVVKVNPAFSRQEIKTFKIIKN